MGLVRSICITPHVSVYAMYEDEQEQEKILSASFNNDAIKQFDII